MVNPMGSRTLGWAAVGACLTWLVCVGQAADPTAPELSAALQRKYASVRDFSADFTQQVETGVLKKRTTPERGRMMLKKPGMMRWEYTAPEEKLFVADGVNFYTYVRQDRQVFISPMPAGDQVSTPILFLAGKGDLVRDFTPSLTETPAGMPAGTRALKLTPKKPQPEYDWLTLAFDAATFQLRGFSTLEAEGRLSSVIFTNLKENVGIPQDKFVFKPPRGVDVVNDASSR